MYLFSILLVGFNFSKMNYLKSYHSILILPAFWRMFPHWFVSGFIIYTYNAVPVYVMLLLNILPISLIARFIEPTWGPSGADRTQLGPMLAPWTLLSGLSPLGLLGRVCTETWIKIQNFFLTKMLLKNCKCLKWLCHPCNMCYKWVEIYALEDHYDRYSIIACKYEMWGVFFFKHKLWFIFRLGFCSNGCSIMLYWTML